jgi:hypothetical protein
LSGALKGNGGGGCGGGGPRANHELPLQATDTHFFIVDKATVVSVCRCLSV